MKTAGTSNSGIIRRLNKTAHGRVFRASFCLFFKRRSFVPRLFRSFRLAAFRPFAEHGSEYAGYAQNIDLHTLYLPLCKHQKRAGSRYRRRRNEHHHRGRQKTAQKYPRAERQRAGPHEFGLAEHKNHALRSQYMNEGRFPLRKDCDFYSYAIISISSVKNQPMQLTLILTNRAEADSSSSSVSRLI